MTTAPKVALVTGVTQGLGFALAEGLPPRPGALVTGATQGLGFALAEGLARQLDARDTVYLTGRDAGRVARAVNAMPGGGAQVRGEVFDVGRREAASRLAAHIGKRHGGTGIRVSKRVLRVGPDDDPRAIV